MRKFLPILLLLLCFGLNAQDTTKTDPPKITWTEKDIKVDSAAVHERAFAKNFKKKYRDDAFVYQKQATSLTLWDRFKAWLAQLFSNFFKIGGGKAADMAGLFLKILAVLVFLFVAYLIAKAILNKDGQWVFGRSSSKKIQRYDDIERNLQAVNFEKLIEETLLAGNTRLAVRYYYLWLLKKLAEREIITWDIEKTNSDYLYEIRNEKHREDFGYLSYLYNYIWYGEFDLTEETFEKTQQAFKKTIRTL